MKNESCFNEKSILKTYLNFIRQSWQLCTETNNFRWTRTAKKAEKRKTGEINWKEYIIYIEMADK